MRCCGGGEVVVAAARFRTDLIGSAAKSVSLHLVDYLFRLFRLFSIVSV